VRTPLTQESRWARLRVGDSDDPARAILESNVVSVIIWDAVEGRLIDANELFLATFGYSREDVESGAIDLARLSAPGWEAASAKVAVEVAATGRSAPYQRELLRNDGTPIWVMATVARYDAARGWNVAYLTDLTAQKRAEAEARRLEQRFRALVEKSNDAIVLLDREFRVLYASPAIEPLLGITPESWIGQVALDLAHPEELPRLLPIFAEVAAQPGRSVRMQTRGLHKSGSVFAVDQTVTNLLEDPAVAAIVVNVRDVTAEKQALEELRKSEERNRQIVETTTQGIWIVDAERRTTFVNRRMAQMLGRTPEEVIGKKSADFFATPDQAQLDEIRAQLQRGENARGVGRILRTDGSELWIASESLALKDENGAYRGSMTMITDLTESRRAEAALRRTEEQLQHSQRLEAVGRLAGGIAHDFNNILTIILSYSALALSEVRQQDPVRHELEEIKKAGERAANLTRQLLAFSRRQLLQPKVINLKLLIDQMEGMIVRLVGEDVELRTTSAPELGQVKVDPGQIEQVVMNLVVNARDAMPDGGRLSIELANVDFGSEHASDLPHGAQVMLAVSDTGIGMNEATRARIFEPFFTTKDPGKGTGLGLSTVFGIVQQSGGHITVESEVGRGTDFRVYLPRAAVEAIEEPAAPILGALTGSETVLVVEDDQRVRNVTATILRRQGYKVIEAESGDDALTLCQQHFGKIALMVTDVVMPKMNGRQLAEKIMVFRPGLKVLFVSGYTDHAIVAQGILEPGIEFLQKPFTPEALSRRVREVLDS
jgi:two-component system, cell cycle sensor histidine kinase and response regulator CckA